MDYWAALLPLPTLLLSLLRLLRTEASLLTLPLSISAYLSLPLHSDSLVYSPLLYLNLSSQNQGSLLLPV